MRENDELRVLLPYSVHLNASANGSTRELAIVAVTMRLTYRLLDKEIGDDVLEAFAAISPFMHSWPYLRATVQELTTKLGLPPLLLPVAVSGHAEQIVRMKALGRAEHGPRPKRAKGSKS